MRDVFHVNAGFKTVPENLTLRQFLPILTETDQHVFPVVNVDGELTGMFSITDVREILVDRGLDDLLIMREIATDDPPVATPDEDLAAVLSRLIEHEVDILPVVDPKNPRKILGMLRRNDVTRSYYEKLQSIKHIAMS